MTKTISFSSSKFKLHNGGMTSSELIKKKREKQINQNIELNNNIMMRNNKIVGVKSYSTYMELTRPKHMNIYAKNVVSGHNLYKVVNKNGSIHERRDCSTGECGIDMETISSEYLEKTIREQTNIDMSFNEAVEEAESGYL